jgi:hypothetical protein
MSRKYNTPHAERAGRKSYSKRGKSRRADKYGVFTNGRQDSPDKVAGATLTYPRDEVGK